MNSIRSVKSVQLLAGGLIALLALTSQAADNRQQRATPSVDRHGLKKLAVPVSASMTLPENVRAQGGLFARERVQVLIRLKEVSTSEADLVTTDSGRKQKARVRAQQDRFVARHRGVMRVLARTHAAANTVAAEVDSKDIAALRSDPDVARVVRVHNYRMSLSETVPYIGAAAVQAGGLTGAGIRVGVIDSGIDYYHADLGGAGNPGDYANDDPNVLEPGTFPTAKVVGGADFVGSTWPDEEELAPDPDPLDDGPEGGHGTHVADIIGGPRGVAPGVVLYALKACSSVSTSCSGIALMQAMDFAVDPNGDGDTSDHLNIVNMSLGSRYSVAFDDDLSLSVDNAAKIGVLTVAAAGNDGDKPYAVSAPSAAASAISVAQTQVPSATQAVLTLTAPASIAGIYAAVFQPWSAPLAGNVSGPVVYGNGAGGNLNGCAPFAPGSVAGRVVLVDRGVCAFSLKISNIAEGGAGAGIIGLVAPGGPFQGAFGGGTPDIPGYMISQADASLIKAAIGAGQSVAATFDPANDIPVVRHMVDGSARGPTNGANTIKPEIGAPGASVSAIAGSGTEREAFGGTSGATPMVTGSAALLLQAYPRAKPHEIKGMLTSTAETDIMNAPLLFGGDLAPITRIGSGEVRVDRALAAGGAVWEEASRGALSFGFADVDQLSSLRTERITVKNFSDRFQAYNVSTKFRYADDEATGAVRLLVQPLVFIPPRGQVTIPVALVTRGDRLNDWSLNSGSLGASGDALTSVEYDGYIKLKSLERGGGELHLPWQFLPRKAGAVTLSERRVAPNGSTKLKNGGVGTSLVEAYSLIGMSGPLPSGGQGEQNPVIDLRYVGYSTIPVPAGFCSADASFIMLFAVNTWERQQHALAPALFEWDLDVNQDGAFDYAVVSLDASGSTELTDGRSLAFVFDLATGDASAFFFTDHETNSGNTVLPICGEQIGMNATNFFQPMDVEVYAVDHYFSGAVTDYLAGITMSPLGEQYLGVFANGDVGSTTLTPKQQVKMQVVDYGELTNNTETGLLLLNRNGAKREARTVIVTGANDVDNGD